MQQVQTIYEDTTIDKEIYRYRCNGKYILDGEFYPIEFKDMHSIVIDYDYINLNMPIMYIILNIKTKVHDIIAQNKDKGTFYFEIQKAVYNSDSPDMWENYIESEFIYYTSVDINKTDSIDYADSNADRDDIIIQVTYGLLPKNMVDNNKHIVNGVISSPNVMSFLVYLMGSSNKLLIEPLDDNSRIYKLHVPPINSISKSIEYLYNHKVFYNTPYRYFMDFDVSYLLSYKGIATQKETESITTVYIRFINEINPKSKQQGMIIKNGRYEIEVGGEEIDFGDIETYAKIRSNIKYNSTYGDQKTKKYTVDDNVAEKTQNFRVPNDNWGLISNAQKLLEEERYIYINKIDLDTSVLTPNKEYQFDTKDVYPDKDLDGKWVLLTKRELYFKSSGTTSTADDRFTLYLLLAFKKAIEN